MPRLGVLGWTSIVLLACSGLGLAVPGAWLLLLGGSPYYVLAGGGLLATAVLVAMRRRLAFWVFAALVWGTLLWGLFEAGLDFWALMPRLIFFIVAGVWLLLVFLRSGAVSRASRIVLAASLAAATILLLFPLLLDPLHRGEGAAGAFRPVAAGAGDWASYGNTNADRFSPLGEITSANAGGLKKAWTYHTGLHGPDGKRSGSLELTPLMADGRIYGCTPFSTIFALDPVTGRELWRRDTLVRNALGGHPVCRGVSFFRAPAGTADCPTRLLLGTLDNRLIALDAATGAPCAGFGKGGAVDLLENMGRYPQGWMHPTSPPTIVNGTAVIGAFVADNQSTDVPPGVIRGYDALTGALKWAFDAGRPESQRPLAPGERYTPSTPNSWTIFSGDPALNLVFVPMGNGSPDFFGRDRSKTTDRFSSALVALDATTGAIRWTFQSVHHDLWDYDLAAQATLVDFPMGADRVPALILPTKTGQMFVLDRRTGRPLVKVEERSAPTATTTGERPAPTQPFAVGMPSFEGDRLTERDMWGLTPFDQLYCRIAFRRADYRGIYTPMGLKPSIRYPGELGGIDWGGVSVDPSRDLLMVNSNHLADLDQIIPREQATREGLVPRVDPRGHFAPGGPMAGTPYGVHWGPFMSPLGVPCQRPPFGYLTAIDLKSRRIAWSRPLGDARNSGPFGASLGLPIPLGAPNIGGTLVTAGGVVFVAATQDEMFRAFDSGTGKLVWQTQLPASGHATPMSYRGSDGRQYVLIAAGGRALKDRPGDEIVAFRLP